VRVGLVESQRRELRVLMRQQLRGVNRPERRSAAEFSGIQPQRDHLKRYLWKIDLKRREAVRALP